MGTMRTEQKRILCRNKLQDKSRETNTVKSIINSIKGGQGGMGAGGTGGQGDRGQGGRGQGGRGVGGQGGRGAGG